jgi:succinyl-CoA synthetase beta subunit
MNLHEYQGKELLASYGVAVQRGIVAENVEQAVEAFHKVNNEFGSSFAVVKAQIHAGGRGKGGGRQVGEEFRGVKV